MYKQLLTEGMVGIGKLQKYKGTQFRFFVCLFFTATELCPPDPLMGRQALHSLLCCMLTRMEAVGKKTKTFLYYSSCKCVCVCVCVCERECVCVCEHFSDRISENFPD